MRHAIHTSVLLLLLAPSAWSQGGLLAEHTPFATPWFAVESGRPGPVVLVVGGMHGDEPAGAAAAEQICSWKLSRGKLLVLPRANLRGLGAGTRSVPGAEGGAGDLNRAFPRRAGEAPRGALAGAIWGWVRRARPQWLLDLHESRDFRRRDAKRFGNAIITPPVADMRRIGAELVQGVDATLPEGVPRFVLLGRSGPAEGSLARAAFERLGVRAMILETTSKGQPLSARIRQHRVLVHHLLRSLEMVRSGVHTLVSRDPHRERIHVAMYDDLGASGKGPAAIERILRADPGLCFRRIGALEIRAGCLGSFDVLIHPGGSGSRQGRTLGEAGRKAIQRWIRAGGGFVGICAGAYLAATNYEWSLGVIDAEVIDRKHWRRGRGVVHIEFTPQGRRILGASAGPQEMLYANGPILRASARAAIPDFTTLAIFRSDMARNGAPRGIMPGTPAIAAGALGRGRAIAFSSHPEQSPGLEALLGRAVRWAAQRFSAR